MNAPAPAAAEFSSYVDEWLEYSPWVRLQRVFLPAARSPAYEAHACLEHALIHASCSVREREPALAKLAWWHEEVQRACEGGARHPVARRLHALGALDGARRANALSLVRAACGIAASESPPDIEALLAPYAEFATAAHVLRTGAPPPEPARQALGAALLVEALRHWETFAAPQRARVPLSLLARAGATREGLARDADKAAMVLGALAAALPPLLAQTAGDAIADAGIVAAGHTLRAIRRDPAACLARPPPLRSLPLLLDLWRLARRTAAARRLPD